MKYKQNHIKNIIKQAFLQRGMNNLHATISANAMIKAELVGAPSHGIARLKMYCERINKKLININPKIKTKNIK